MKNLALISAIVIISLSAALAQTNGQVVASGNGFSYILNVPTGWESSLTVAAEQHLKVILIPNGSSWENSKSVIYSSVTFPDMLKGETIFDIIDYDIAMYEMNDPNLVLDDGNRLQVNRGEGIAMVIKVSSTATGKFEAIAYINHGDRVPFIVLSSMDQASFDRDYPIFEQVVSSYKYFANSQSVSAK